MKSEDTPNGLEETSHNRGTAIKRWEVVNGLLSCPLMDGLWCLLYFPKQFHKTLHGVYHFRFLETKRLILWRREWASMNHMKGNREPDPWRERKMRP